MHSIIFATIRPPDEDRQKSSNWFSLVQRLQEIAKTKPQVEMLGEGCWLLRGGSGLPFLGEASTLAERSGIDHRMILVEAATEWPEPPTPDGA